MASLQALQHDFIFTFLNQTRDGMIVNKHKFLEIVTPEVDNQGKLARWARVHSIGSKVTEFKVGDLVLIEPLKWTIGLVWEGTKYWKSDDSKVLAISNDESVAITY